jgi:hypothetical protein
MAKFEYRNIKEVILEDLLSEGLLNDEVDDGTDLIEDALCATLSNVKPVYVINRADFFYSLGPEELDKISLDIVEKFNMYIDKFRNQDKGSQEWQD